MPKLLPRLLDYPELELSNNLEENSSKSGGDQSQERDAVFTSAPNLARKLHRYTRAHSDDALPIHWK
jgi:hypothetical protein